VLGIIAIVTSIAIPMINGVSNAEMRSARSPARLRAASRAQRSGVAAARDVPRHRPCRTPLQGRPRRPASMPCRAMSSSSCSPPQKDLVDEKTGSIRFFPDGGSNGGRITLAAGERKFEVDVDWLTGRVAILD